MTSTAADRPDDFWSSSTDQFLTNIGATAGGLAADEARTRLERFGPNAATPRRHATTLRLLAAQFTSPVTILLAVAAALSMALGEATDGTIIIGILVASGAIGFWQERRATGAVEQLLALVRMTATVVRDGHETEVPVEDVVPGDVVRLSAGAGVPADCRLLVAKDLFVDQSALTGESFPAEKSAGAAPAAATLADRRNVVWLGTHVVSGTGDAVVARTGAATQFGHIAERLAQRPAETEFERGVRRFGTLLLQVTLVLVILIFAINVALHRPVLDALLFTLALAVGLTPQLLPAIVSITLAQGAKRMAADRVIVRRLVSIEDLGGMEILCTDKTGTITEGVIDIQACEDWTGAASARARTYAHLNAALETGFTNPIDEALRRMAPEADKGYAKFDEVPYDFVRKRLSVAVTGPDGPVLITKGAVATVLAACSRAEDAAGHESPLAEVRDAIQSRFETLSRDGFRCLGIACRTLPSNAAVTRDDEHDLAFLGIVSFADPLRPGAAATIAELAGLGIATKIITGDNRHVAQHIAADLQMGGAGVVTGEDMRGMSDAALTGLAPSIGVFAEVEPNQKERIILALKRTGRSVGYLGDGINDAAALHAADVGISVSTATDVTRQAADVVLLEKDLGVLARGVREGRRAFANTLKYVYITTSASFGNMFSMAGASLFATFLPLLPKQILLINVLTDLPAMAIATDRLDPELVSKPRRWDTKAIRRFMIGFGLVSSAFDFLTFGVLLAFRVDAVTFRTAWFLESVISELLILLVIRTSRPFFKSQPSPALTWATLGVAAVTMVLPYTPLAEPLGFASPPGWLLAIVTGIVVLYAVTSDLSKHAIIRRDSRLDAQDAASGHA